MKRYIHNLNCLTEEQRQNGVQSDMYLEICDGEIIPTVQIEGEKQT